MKKGKKAQVTIFIIIAISLALIFLVIYLNKDKITLINKDPEIGIAQELINDCFELGSQNSPFLFGKQGGIVNPEKTIEIEGLNISVLYSKDEIELLTVSEMENELSELFNENFLKCIDNFSYLESRGYITERGILESEIRLNDEVEFEINFPVNIRKEESSYQLKNDYSKTIPIRFDRYYGLIDKIISQQKTNPGDLDIVSLLDYGLNINATRAGDNLVFLLEDDKSETNNKTYKFLFGVEIN